MREKRVNNRENSHEFGWKFQFINVYLKSAFRFVYILLVI